VPPPPAPTRPAMSSAVTGARRMPLR
jgi:hypothetical protein